MWKADPMFGIGVPSDFDVEMLEVEMRRVRCPVLVLMGDRARHLARPDAEEEDERAGVAPAPDTRSVPGAGHYVHLEQPDIVDRRACAAFLARGRARDAGARRPARPRRPPTAGRALAGGRARTDWEAPDLPGHGDDPGAAPRRLRPARARSRWRGGASPTTASTGRSSSASARTRIGALHARGAAGPARPWPSSTACGARGRRPGRRASTSCTPASEPIARRRRRRPPAPPADGLDPRTAPRLRVVTTSAASPALLGRDRRCPVLAVETPGVTHARRASGPSGLAWFGGPTTLVELDTSPRSRPRSLGRAWHAW